MADEDSSHEAGAGLDAAGLRAKLGLPPKSPAAPIRPVAQREPQVAAPALDAYDDDKTPVPRHLAETVQDAEMDLDLPGGARQIPLKPALVVLLIASLVGILLGQVLGDSLAQREQKETHQRIVAKKLSMIQEATTQSGTSVVKALEDMHVALSEAVTEIDLLEAAGGDPLKLEKVFEVLLPKLIEFKRDGVFIDPERVMDGITVIYADDLLLETARFAVRSRHLYDTLSATIEEATALAKIGRPSGAGTQTIYAERYMRDMGDGSKIPAARGQWVKDTGKPDLVKLVDERTRKKTTEWQMMVLTEGKKDPEQVPTDRVVSLEMKPIYEKHGLAVRLHTVDRLAKLIRTAKSRSQKLAWKALERRLKDWVAP